MRALLVLSLLAGGLVLLDHFYATAASPSRALETQIEALTDAVCFHMQETNQHHQRFGGITPKACRTRPHIVFVSSRRFSGIFFPPGDADARCRELAADAGLPGFYRAWATNESGPGGPEPALRFARAFAPYVLVDGTVVANDWDDLTDGTLLAPIDLNERGEQASVEVWTNVGTDGTQLEPLNADTCDGFRSDSPTLRGRHGISTETGSAWTNAGFDTCDQEKALYCFSQ